jgi:hypothetical protein
MQQNQEGFRVFEKAISGLVFESFYLLDVEAAAPGIVIVASDAVSLNSILHITTI